MDENIRDLGKNAIGTILKKEQNIRILEKEIYTAVSDKEDDRIVMAYKNSVYQTISEILNGNKLANILSEIKEGNINWEHSECQEYIKEQEEEDDFLENPFEIEEGVLECGKCHSKRVYSYSKQDRAGDEATSVFAYCINCKSKWRAN